MIFKISIKGTHSNTEPRAIQYKASECIYQKTAATAVRISKSSIFDYRFSIFVLRKMGLARASLVAARMENRKWRNFAAKIWRAQVDDFRTTCLEFHAIANIRALRVIEVELLSNPMPKVIDFAKEKCKFTVVKRTDLFIFLDLLFAIFIVASLGTVPLVGQSTLFSALLVSVFAITWGVNFDLESKPIIRGSLNYCSERVRPRKVVIQFLDPLLI